VTEQEKLDEALRQLDKALRLWGIDNHLGYRTAQTLKLSASGACNLVALVEKLTDEVGRLSILVGELVVTR
jgi:hypothetical protein